MQTSEVHETTIEQPKTEAVSGTITAQSDMEAEPRSVHPIVMKGTSGEDLIPEGEGGDCECGSGGSCGCSDKGTDVRYLYAIGEVSPVFPSESLLEQFRQEVGITGTHLPDNFLLYQVLTQNRFAYIARQLCWLMEIDNVPTRVGIEAYVVKPRTYIELTELVNALLPNNEKRYTVVIGGVGPVVSPDTCAGNQLPLALANNLYNFTKSEFAQYIHERTNVPVEDIVSTFEQLLAVTDNLGQTDGHRANNYITLRYPEVYRQAARLREEGFTFVGVTTQPAGVQGERVIEDVVFSFENRVTNLRRQFFVSVDVTGQFPFLVSEWAEFFFRN